MPSRRTKSRTIQVDYLSRAEGEGTLHISMRDGLIDLLGGIEAAILIDAVCSGVPPGTVHEFSFAELAQHGGHFVSSHELGIAAAVQLARKLGHASARGGMLGIEIAALPPDAQVSPLSPEAYKAVREVLVQVHRWVRKLICRFDTTRSVSIVSFYSAPQVPAEI